MPILCLNLSQHNKLTRLIDVHTVTETGIQVITYATYAVAREKKKISKNYSGENFYNVCLYGSWLEREERRQNFVRLLRIPENSDNIVLSIVRYSACN